MKKTKILHLLVIFCLSILVCSCSSTRELAKDNYFINKTDFYNDTLNLTGIFPGDIDYFKSANKKVLKKRLKPFKYKDLILHGRALQDYDLYLFYKKNKSGKIEENQLFLNDSINGKVIYIKKNKDAVLTLMLRTFDDVRSQNTLVRDGKTIIDNLKYNDSIKEQLSYFDVLNKNKEKPNVLHIIDKIDHAPVMKSKMNEWGKFQLLITLLSNDPGNQRYIDLFDEYKSRKRKKNGEKIDSILKITSVEINVNAIDKIKSLASQNKVVMLNECHWCPGHRIMAQKLLQPLKELGYNYLAIEAVAENEDSLINENSYPLKSSGYYTKEPYFGLFIRKAKELGYTVISYDYGFSSNNEREEKQAANLAEIHKKDTEAKIFVFAGFAHITEGGAPKKWMAEYFKEITGIDPLTINQEEVIAPNEDEELLLIKPEKFNSIEGIKTDVDYFLINNIEPGLKKIFEEKELIEITLSINDISKYINQQLIILVYDYDEYEKHGFEAVPIVSKIYKVNEDQIKLTVPNKNKMKVKVFDKDNIMVLSQTISPEN